MELPFDASSYFGEIINLEVWILLDNAFDEELNIFWEEDSIWELKQKSSLNNNESLSILYLIWVLF